MSFNFYITVQPKGSPEIRLGEPKSSVYTKKEPTKKDESLNVGSFNYNDIPADAQLSKPQRVDPSCDKAPCASISDAEEQKMPEDITTSGIVIIGHFRLLTQNIETLVLVLYHSHTA